MDQMMTDAAQRAAPVEPETERTADGVETPAGICPACGGAVTAAIVSTALWEGDSLSVVRDVPALVCGACHEHFFADATVMRLDLMRAGGFALVPVVAQMTVPVFTFPATDEGQA